jgi:hypothetical protein
VPRKVKELAQGHTAGEAEFQGEATCLAPQQCSASSERSLKADSFALEWVGVFPSMEAVVVGQFLGMGKCQAVTQCPQQFLSFLIL